MRTPGPDVVSGASGLVEGVKSTKKAAADAKVATYYPVTISDGTANHRTFSFPSNRMRTTKYTPWSFLFKLLWEQYKKATNVCSPQCLSHTLSRFPTSPHHSSSPHRSSFWR